MENTVDHGIFKIRHDLLRSSVGTHVRDPGIDVVPLRLVVLLLRDISELKHLIENIFPPLRIGLRIRDRIVPGRISGNSRDHSALGKGEVGDILVEIVLCRCLNAPVPSAEVDRIQIVFEDPGLVNVHLQSNRKILLLDLPPDLIEKSLLIHPVRKDIVFKELLRNGAGSFRKIPFRNSPVNSSRDTFRIDPDMLVKPFVFNCDDRILK